MIGFSALHLAVAAVLCHIAGATYTTADGKAVVVETVGQGGISLPAEPASRPVTVTVHSVVDPTLVTLAVVEFDPINERERPATRQNYPMAEGEEGVWTAVVEFRPGKVYHLDAAAVQGSHVWKADTVNVANN